MDAVDTMGGSLAASGISDKGFVPAILLCFFLGTFGIHRFYAGKIGTGILMLVTFGGLGIWTLVDFIIIVSGNFKDKAGLPIKASS
ncbi:MAG: TM2 domain-containing protein [Myxococcota bacterium]